MNNAEINLNYRRLMEINRCNNFQTIKKEDVAQHSFYVALYSTIIAREYNKNTVEHGLQSFDIKTVMENALFHDIEETFVSDIPHNVKHHDENTNIAVERAVSSIIDSMYDRTFAKNFIDINRRAKVGFEGKLIDIVDMLELGLYCCEEVSKGNKLMRPLLKKAVNIIKVRDLFDELMEFSPTFEYMFIMLNADCDNMSDIYTSALNID